MKNKRSLIICVIKIIGEKVIKGKTSRFNKGSQLFEMYVIARAKYFIKAIVQVKKGERLSK